MPEITINQTWRVDDVLTNVDSALLSDPTEAFGIKRNDTGEIVAADETPMANPSTGVYRYTFTALNGVSYTAFVEIAYGGAVYHFEKDISVPASTEEELIGLEAAAASPKSTSIEGESVTEHSLMEQIELDRYLAEKKAAARKRPPIRLTKLIPGGTT